MASDVLIIDEALSVLFFLCALCASVVIFLLLPPLPNRTIPGWKHPCRDATRKLGNHSDHCIWSIPRFGQIPKESKDARCRLDIDGPASIRFGCQSAARFAGCP